MKGNSKKIDRKSIGWRIRREREKLGISREELAEMTGFSVYYIGQLERGERQMSLPALAEIASKLRISLDYLIWGKEESHPPDSYVFEKEGSHSGDLFREWEEVNCILKRFTVEELELFKTMLKTIIHYLSLKSKVK